MPSSCFSCCCIFFKKNNKTQPEVKAFFQDPEKIIQDSPEVEVDLADIQSLYILFPKSNLSLMNKFDLTDIKMVLEAAFNKYTTLDNNSTQGYTKAGIERTKCYNSFEEALKKSPTVDKNFSYLEIAVPKANANDLFIYPVLEDILSIRNIKNEKHVDGEGKIISGESLLGVYTAVNSPSHIKMSFGNLSQ